MENEYTFVSCSSQKYQIFENRDIQEYLMKWSIKSQFKIQTYSFNERFQFCMKSNFVESFFKSSEIVATLQGFSDSWQIVGTAASSVKTELVPCSVLSMSFFDPLVNPENRIVTSEGSISKCFYDIIDDFDVNDELRQLLLNEESPHYRIFSASDRSEFIFRLFQALCLGGKWCQYEDNIKPYLEVTKLLYKDLVRVQRNPSTKEVYIPLVVLKVIAKDMNGVPYYPRDPEHTQNFAYLIIDPIRREVTTFIHQFGGCFE